MNGDFRDRIAKILAESNEKPAAPEAKSQLPQSPSRPPAGAGPVSQAMAGKPASTSKPSGQIQRTESRPTVSRRAAVSLVLGILSLGSALIAGIVVYRELVARIISDFHMILGIPALIIAFGAGGFSIRPANRSRRDIAISEGRLRGRGFAVCGL